ncbi:MAG: hypothetical protein K5829_09695 [Treponema sp.]|nr:hypothetical protein [Treponema sp.]
MKKILILLVALSISFTLFSQNAKSTGLSDRDVKNWAKNYDSIEDDLEEIGIYENDDVSRLSAKKKAQAEKILEKNGISSPNSIEKYAMIQQCAALLMMESQMDAQSMALMKAMGMDPLEELRANINEKDYALVAANSKAVLKVVKDIEDDEADEDDYDDDDMENPYLAANNAILEGLHSSIMQPEIDQKNNENQEIKDFYEAFSSSKGDCDFIYKSLSPKNLKLPKVKMNLEEIEFTYGDEFDDDFDRDYDPYSDSSMRGFDGEVDFKKKTVTIHFYWTEYSRDKNQIISEKLDCKLVEKNLKYSISSFEAYQADEKALDGNSISEFVVTTKEGLVLHFYSFSSFDGNEVSFRVAFSGHEPFECYWFYEK